MGEMQLTNGVINFLLSDVHNTKGNDRLEIIANEWVNNRVPADPIYPNDYLEMANTCRRKQIVKFMVTLEKLGIPYHE